VHYLCEQLTCGDQVCMVGASSDMGAANAWDLTYLSGHRGQHGLNGQKHFGTTRVAQIITGAHRDL